MTTLRRVLLGGLAGCVAALALVPAAVAQPGGPRIVGGHEASRPWPAMASVQVQHPSGGRSYCGGTLVAPRAVLTAAHCLEGGRTRIDVLLGRRTLDSPGGEALQADAAEILGGYIPEGSSPPKRDLALLRLTSPSAATPQPMVDAGDGALTGPGAIATILGWGTLSPNGPFNRSIPLQQAEVPLVADPDCASAYGRDFVPATMLCAGYAAGGVDTCQGDSGGPLLVALGPSAFRLAGVTSWGDGCAAPGRPGVYTRLLDAGLQAWLRAQVALDGFSFSPAAPRAGERVVLRSTASSPSGGPAISGLAWDLDGDGAFDDATGATPATTFASAGRATLRLEVTRAGGARSVTESVVEVGAGPSPAALQQAPPAPAAPTPAPAARPAPAPAPAPRPAPAPAAQASTSLTITLSAPGRPARRATLRCAPAGGTWPSPAASCARVLRASGRDALLRPLGSTRGRVAVARAALSVRGTLAGHAVRVSLPARGSMAARRRFLELRAVLGAAAVDRAIRVLHPR